MEAAAHLASPWDKVLEDFVLWEAAGWDSDVGPGGERLSPTETLSGLGRLVGNADALRDTLAEDASGFGVFEAADFADRVEELSRAVEFLQVVAAQAVERTRRQAAVAASRMAASSGWQTGWTEPESEGSPTAADSAAAPGPAAQPAAVSAVPAVAAAAARAVVDDGYRNTAEFLRGRLRIGISEARRRLELARAVLPTSGLAGQTVPARHETLAAAVAHAEVPSRSATTIATALEKVRPVADPEKLAQMEESLTRTAAECDPDFVGRMARRWVEAIDQDGTEPSEEELRRRQGVFLRRPRRGLQHLEIFATPDQFETLSTVMNTATNPRLQATEDGEGAGEAGAGIIIAGDGAVSADKISAAVLLTGPVAGHGSETATEPGAGDGERHDDGPPLDLRTRAQKLLDGLVGACGLALATGKLPATGGLRPQVMVTIDYQDLYNRLTGSGGAARPHNGGSTGSGSGTAIFTGPITASTIRKIACDADVIPVLLGSQGRVLNIGRASRIFPPHIRKAITARDQGCAFPDCTLPAPWCEAHHVAYWSHGGETSTENGVLLCSHHHHLIHKEQWQIQPRSGVPWFIPPPHIDPRQTPKRNQNFTPLRT